MIESAVCIDIAVAVNPADWKATDFNNDNQLDARDLSMMKRELMKL